jgi:predicted permease
MALAVVLVIGAGLMARSYWSLVRVDGGFRTEGVLAVQLTIPAARYPEAEEVKTFFDRFAEMLEARPGVRRVGTVARLPLDGPSWSSQFQAEGWPPDRVGYEILHRRADAGYFEALEIPLVAGRMFEAGDRAGPDESRRVLLVNEAFAGEHFRGEDPVGRRIAFTASPGPGTPWWEIIGVVGDQPQESLAQPTRPEVFESRFQDWGRDSWVVIRGDEGAGDLLGHARAALGELDALIPIAEVRTLADVRSASLARESLVLALLVTFGFTALALAAVGVYAVTARAARRRTREVGIRMALGARARDVRVLMVRQGLGAVVVGLVVGLAVALASTRVLASLLYGVAPTDPATLGAVVALLAGVALLACWAPVRRATTVDPLRALQAE